MREGDHRDAAAVGVPLDEHDDAFAALPAFRLAPPRIETFLGMVEPLTLRPQPTEAAAPAAGSPYFAALQIGEVVPADGGLVIAPVASEQPAQDDHPVRPDVPLPAVPSPPEPELVAAARDDVAAVWQLEPSSSFQAVPLAAPAAAVDRDGAVLVLRRAHVEAGIVYALIIAMCAALLVYVVRADDSSNAPAKLPGAAKVVKPAGKSPGGARPGKGGVAPVHKPSGGFVPSSAPVTGGFGPEAS
jgi:hypothetical protein